MSRIRLLLNNMLGEEDLNPHGFFSWQSGIRLPSMMAPTALLKDNRAELVLGSAGSNRIRSAARVHYEKGAIYCEPPLHV